MISSITPGLADVGEFTFPDEPDTAHICVHIGTKVIAKCGIQGAPDEAESYANAFQISRLWNDYNTPKN